MKVKSKNIFYVILMISVLLLSSIFLLQARTDNPLLLFIIDFDSFLCLPCLDSFLKFCNGLPDYIIEGNVWGILVFDKPEEKGDLLTRIAEKKLKGFISANDIKFPIIVDRFHIFDRLGQEGTVLIIFDNQGKSIRKYVFPLSQNKIDEIRRKFHSLKRGL